MYKSLESLQSGDEFCQTVAERKEGGTLVDRKAATESILYEVAPLVDLLDMVTQGRRQIGTKINATSTMRCTLRKL